MQPQPDIAHNSCDMNKKIKTRSLKVCDIRKTTKCVTQLTAIFYIVLFACFSLKFQMKF